MSASNIYAANPVEEDVLKVYNNNPNQDSYTVRPQIQKNNQEEENEVRTLLNPVLIETKEDNEFSKFDDEDKSSDGDSVKGDNNKENDQEKNILDKLKPVKMNSSSSVDTLDAQNDNAQIEQNNNDQVISNKKEEVNGQNDDNIKVKAMRKSLTENDIKIPDDQKHGYSSSSNLRNPDVKEGISNRKYRSLASIDDDGSVNIDFNNKDKQEFRSINHIIGPNSINRSIELFASKQKNKTMGSSKIENVNFIDIGNNNLERLLFMSENCSEVRRVNASFNYLTELPPNIGIFEKLVELNVSDNKLTTIPSEIGYLKNLEVLNLNNNSISSFPYQIGGLRNLRFLYLSKNELQTFPREFGLLRNLEGLYANHNKISKIPVEFLRLQKLKVLDLSYNSLFCFKFKMSLLRKLEKLYLSGNQFPKFPNELTQMDNLCELYMDNNKITVIPDEINNMKRLKILRLNNNKIQKIPDTICQNKKLRILRLQNNLIESLPEKINHMRNLRELNIDNNAISEIPTSIALLPRLRKISYEGNCFSPEEMENKIFAINSLELANNEYVQKYCYRPPRDSFIQRAIDSIPTRDPESTEPNNEDKPENAVEQDQEKPQDGTTSANKEAVPAVAPEKASTNTQSNSTLTANYLSDQQQQQPNDNVEVDKQQKIDSNAQSEQIANNETDSSDLRKTDESVKDSSADANNTTTELNTLENYNEIAKSIESLKLKLIDVVLPEDITNSLSNFIFEYEESIRSSIMNLEESKQTPNSSTDKGSKDSLEKQIFKKKYEHVPSKLGAEPLTIEDSEENKSEEDVKRSRYEDFVIERIPLKKGDDYEEEDVQQSKFSRLAMGSTELLHEKLKH